MTRLPQLQESGHPKWQNVDLQDIPPGWDIGNCVNPGLQPDYQLRCEAPLASAESDASRAYREYICATMGC